MKTAHRNASLAKHQIRHQAAIYGVMTRMQPLVKEEHATMMNPIRMAYERMRIGSATQADIEALQRSMKFGEVRSESIDALCVEVFVRALESLDRIQARAQRTRTIGLDAQAMQDLQAGMDLVSDLLEKSTMHEILTSGDEAARRLRAEGKLNVKADQTEISQ